MTRRFEARRNIPWSIMSKEERDLIVFVRRSAGGKAHKTTACDQCGAQEGKRCVTSGGKERGPHLGRLKKYQEEVFRQANEAVDSGVSRDEIRESLDRVEKKLNQLLGLPEFHGFGDD